MPVCWGDAFSEAFTKLPVGVPPDNLEGVKDM